MGASVCRCQYLQSDTDFVEMKAKIDNILAKSKVPSNSIYYIIVSQEMFHQMEMSGESPDFDMILDKHLFIWI